MRRIQDGEMASMNVLFERYQRPMYNFFMKSTFDAVASEELTQELFIRMLRYSASYRPELGSVKSWLFRMAANLHINYRNAQSKKAMHSVVLTESHLAVAETNDARRFTEEEYEKLGASLQQLKTEQRQLIVLSKYQGLKYEEIASITGLSVVNVRVKIHRAILALREVYFKPTKPTV